MTEAQYIGTELELFREAEQWKNYWGSKVAPYLKGRVVEVGAGIGGTTRILRDRSKVREWFCLEPDSELSGRIAEETQACRSSERIHVRAGYLSEFFPELEVSCDGVLYIDVIEHIEDDRAELKNAWKVLKPDGILVVLVPAHPFLFSEFDQAIGHYRRYNRKSLRRAIPDHFAIQKIQYLDSVGMAASIANRILLRQSSPRIGQIRFWDRCMIPISKVLDPLLFHRFGKSLLLVARKKEG